MDDTRFENHSGVIYAMRPIVCEQHRMPDGSIRKVIVGGGMMSERGLICPICYATARYASDKEAAAFHE